MADDEEAQVAEDFGRMVRIATGSAMQVAEARNRRRQVGASVERSTTDAQQRMEENASRVIQGDLYRNEFWKHAGSESIADRMSVAASLGENNPAAQSAWMHGADVIRNTYGVDVGAINRKHPNSLEERHEALRDALDDAMQKTIMDGRADEARERENAPEVSRRDDAETAIEGDGQRAGAARESEKWEAEADRENMEEGQSRERAERAEDADRAADPVVDTDGLAARRDFARERAEENRDARERASTTGRVDLAKLDRSASPEQAQARVRQLQGFALDPQKALAATKQHRRAPARGKGAEQGRQEVISR